MLALRHALYVIADSAALPRLMSFAGQIIAAFVTTLPAMLPSFDGRCCCFRHFITPIFAFISYFYFDFHRRHFRRLAIFIDV